MFPVIGHLLGMSDHAYGLWAIVIGLIIANTVGVPKIFRAGVATYEFWLKLGIVLLGVRFLLGDVLKLGGISLVAVALAPRARSTPRTRRPPTRSRRSWRSAPSGCSCFR